MPTAEIIAIGTELLLGITQDTNTRFLAQELNRLGFDLFRTTIIGDNYSRITNTIQEAVHRADLVITSGGLGPTVDDPTRQAVADAFNEELEFHPELWEAIQSRFIRLGREASENNMRQAFIPRNAKVIENSVGTAPAFSIEQENKILVCLPGVPAELHYLFKNSVIPIINRKYDRQQTIFTKIVHTSGLGESRVDEIIADLETKSNPTVGLSAHPGIVDIRITAKGKDKKESHRLMQPILKIIQDRLGEHIFGYDEDTLDMRVRAYKKKSGISLTLLLTSTSSYLEGLFSSLVVFDKVIPTENSWMEIKEKIQKKREDNEYIMGLDQCTEKDSTLIRFFWLVESELIMEKKYFGSHPTLFEPWIINTILDFLRRKLNSKEFE